VLEAQDDLDEHGRESWIAQAVLHELGCRLAWDVLDDCGLLTDLDCSDAPS
jgi:hypothetical protein